MAYYVINYFYIVDSYTFIRSLLCYDHYIKRDDNQHQTTQFNQTHEKDSSDVSKNSNSPKINIFSSDFDIGYMKSASTNGYHGVYKGMTRQEVEDKYGKSDGKVESLKWKYEKYGDLAVAYEDNEVIQVGVAPKNLTEDKFISTYHEPDNKNSDQPIYDNNKDNGFSVLVNVKNGNFTVIENVNQI